MKRILYWLLVTSLTFMLGVIVALLFVKSNQSVNQNLENSYADLPILDYCELANNPEKYDGKIVRVNAQLYGFSPNSRFLDENCNSNKQAEVIFSKDDVKKVSVTQAIAFESQFYWGKPKILAVGKFSKVSPLEVIDKLGDKLYFRFEVINLEKITQAKTGKK